jgi:hypothetical protein
MALCPDPAQSIVYGQNVIPVDGKTGVVHKVELNRTMIELSNVIQSRSLRTRVINDKN